MARLNQYGLYCANGSLYGAELHQSIHGGGFLDISNGRLSGGFNGENTGYLDFGAQFASGEKFVKIGSDHTLMINAERIAVGTNSQQTWWTRNGDAFRITTENEILFAQDSNGNYRGFYAPIGTIRCVTVNGFLT